MNNAMLAAVDPLALGASAQAHHRFAVLDGWRGVAAICVAIFHFSVLLTIAFIIPYCCIIPTML